MDTERAMMRSEEFEARLGACREMPGSGDRVYRSAMNELIAAAGGSIRLGIGTDPKVRRSLAAAIADDRRTRWMDVGSSLLDARIAAFSDLYADADADQRQIVKGSFGGEQLRELEHFVARAARLIEVTGDPQWLRRGLAAACIDGGRYDFRDLIAGLGILRYGAERAGIEVEPYFREALEMSCPPDSSDNAPPLQEIFSTVESYPKDTLKFFVRKFGPPEWSDETKPWWKFW